MNLCLYYGLMEMGRCKAVQQFGGRKCGVITLMRRGAVRPHSLFAIAQRGCVRSVCGGEWFFAGPFDLNDLICGSSIGVQRAI